MMDSQRRAFFRRTRKGKVIRIVNDKYLRKDVGAGYYRGSSLSPAELVALLKKAPDVDTDENGGSTSTAEAIADAASGPAELLVLDTNVALQEIDVLEHKCPATANVLVPQTVLQELRHLNLSVYHRLKALLDCDALHYVFFPNEVDANTVVTREHGESINDANDRAIRTTTTYLQNLLSNEGQEEATVVLLSCDKDMQKKAKADGLECKSLHDYLHRFLDQYPQLGDLLSSSTTGSVGALHTRFPPHLSDEDVGAGMRSGKLFRASLRCVGKRTAPDNWARCYAVVNGKKGGRKFFDVTGHWRVNRAVDGDIVVLEECALEHEASAEEAAFNRYASQVGSVGNGGSAHDAQARVLEETLEASAEALEGFATTAATTSSSSSAAADMEQDSSSDGTDSEDESTAAPPVKAAGRVVGILRRNWRKYAGSLFRGDDAITAAAAAASTSTSGAVEGVLESGGEEGAAGEASSCVFRPVDTRVPPIRIATRRASELQTKRILVTIDTWPADSALPLGHYVHTIGDDGVKDVETQVLLHEFDVPHAEFNADVMACLPPGNWQISEDIIAKRTDLRHIPVVSIDPPGCKDIDDALHCTRLPNGNLQAGVHIADVTHFVHPDTPLDKEAAHRATSTYLVERRLDMLPSLLTTELCSLRSKEDHLAFSVLWEFTPEGDIIDVSFCKSVIHSVASLTYGEAQAMLDAPSDDPKSVSMSVQLLNKLAKILRQRRIDMGALTLASPEVRFTLDAETKNPTDVTAYALKESNALVEEWMLLANITVSKKVLRHYPTLGVLRRHEPPSREQFEPLMDAARAAGVLIDITSSKALADSLDLAVKEDDAYFNKLLRIMSTRCMMPAQYFCSGEIPKEQWHHYGLAAPVYTHFTSPIRRYADVIVHRLLAAAIGVIPLPTGNADRSRQQELCSHLNRRHKAAQHVQRASVNLHTLLYFKNKPSEETAYVMSITADNITVLAPRFGIEGQICVNDIREVLQCEPRFDAAFHKVTFEGATENNSSAGKGTALLQIDMFQPVTVKIVVHGADTPNRCLRLSLMHPAMQAAEAKAAAAQHKPAVATAAAAVANSTPSGGSKKKKRSNGAVSETKKGGSGSGSAPSANSTSSSATKKRRK